MKDVFTESVVKRKPMPGGNVLQAILATIAIFSAMLGFSIHIAMLAVGAIFGVMWYLVRQNADVEFEYIHTNGELDIDKIIANSSRKRMVTVDLSRVDIVAPLDSPEIDRYYSLKTKDFSSKEPDQMPYVMVCTLKDGKKKLLLQLDDNMLESLRKWMPSKVVR